MNDYQYRDLKRYLMKIESMLMDVYDTNIRDKKICPVCKNEIRLYLPFGEQLRYNAQCPVCRSLERHRALWLYFEKNPELFKKKSLKILHFAPESIFLNRFSMDENIDYYPVDLNPNFPGIRKVVDITDISYKDDYFDMIICNHVLEHIPDERKAIAELYRVLSKNGIAFLNVPVSDNLEETLERPEYNTPELRSKYYGQFDHVRKYGKDYPEHLESLGFNVKIIHVNKDYSNQELLNWGLHKGEYVYLCNK